MSIRKDTPCNHDCFCPYDAEYYGDCEWWCGAEEPQDNPIEEENEDDFPF